MGIGINYPNGDNGGIDIFNEPSLPESTPLSQAGTSTRNHVESHHDLGAAIEALEANASFKDHDHSGDGSTRHGNQLLWANTHQRNLPTVQSTLTSFPNTSTVGYTAALSAAITAGQALADTDYSLASIHHTLAARNAADNGEITSGPRQAARADHTHDFNGPSIINQPFQICTTTTRPQNPAFGMMIYETDSNCVRVWSRVNTTQGYVSYVSTSNGIQIDDSHIGGLVPPFLPDGVTPNSAYAPTWQLLPVANTPVLRAEATSSQEITRIDNGGSKPLAKFQRILQDYRWSHGGVGFFTVADNSYSRFQIPESGVYEVKAEIHWDPNRTYHEFSFMQVVVNSQEIYRMNAQYTRAPVNPWGASSQPGQPQSNRIHFNYRFAAGDVLSVLVFHDATRSSFLWHNDITGNKQAANLEIIFRAP